MGQGDDVAHCRLTHRTPDSLFTVTFRECSGTTGTFGHYS